jgi:uncharacterized protein
MPLATIRFYGPLNDFLAPGRRGATLVYQVAGSPSIKDLVEAIGVPHPEINLLVVNGDPVDFAYRVREGDRVSVYPRFSSLEAGAAGLQPAPQTEPQYVADVHLGRLAGYLRLAGFDTLYQNDYSDEEIVRVSAAGDRVVLTRDVGVLKHGIVRRGYFVRATEPARQLAEVLREFDLAHRTAPFTRCVRCNTLLQRVAKDDVLDRLEPRTREHYHDFSRCPTCGRVYWEGSHYARMREFIARACAVAGGPA